MRRTRGFSLPEILVAMAIGAIVLGGLLTYHAQATQLREHAEVIADLADRGRFAMAHITGDVRQAGFYGLTRDVAWINGAAGPSEPVVITVTNDCGPNWSIDLHQPIDARNNHYDLECAPYRGRRLAGPDVLIIRRVSARTTEPTSGRLQVHSGLDEASIDNRGLPPPLAPLETRDLIANAYYISPVSSLGGNQPGLRRKILRAGPRVVDEEIMPGIVDLQVRFGVRSTRPELEPTEDGLAWVDPEHPILIDDQAAVTAVRIWLLQATDGPPGLRPEPIAAYADQPAPPLDSRIRFLKVQTIALRNLQTTGLAQ